MRSLAVLVVAGALTWASASTINHRQVEQSPGFTWEDVVPSNIRSGIEWTPCYRDNLVNNGNVDCARLKVPMDYGQQNASSSSKPVILALIRRRALITVNYQGPVLFNPGGPGNPYLTVIPGDYGSTLHQELGLNRDLITWDPRGVGFSVPRQQCWTSAQRRGIYMSRQPGLAGQYDDDRAFLNNLRRYYLIESAACENLMGEDGVQRYISTYHHAHDMHSIMAALGQTQLQYYGISWGTALGTYFASLFPHSVGRMVLDANVDVAQWPSGDLSSDFSNVEAILTRFFEECASNEHCAIHESTAEAVEERYERILQLARFNSTYAAVSDNWLIDPPLYTSIVQMTQSMGYFPEGNFPVFADILARTEASVDSPEPIPESSLINGTWATPGAPDYSDNSYQDPNNADHAVTWATRGEEYTRCNDIGGTPSDVDSMLAHFEDARRRHRAAGHELQFHWPCMGKKVTREYFKGPFGANLTNPILFTNSRLDPITPLVHAERNAKLFPGSGLVIGEGIGHGMVGRNACVFDHIRRFLDSGVMPAMGAVCADEQPIQWERNQGVPERMAILTQWEERF